MITLEPRNSNNSSPIPEAGGVGGVGGVGGIGHVIPLRLLTRSSIKLKSTTAGTDFKLDKSIRIDQYPFLILFINYNMVER